MRLMAARWPERWADGLTRAGVALALVLGFAALIDRGPAPAIGIGLVGCVVAAITGGVVRIGFEVLDGCARYCRGAATLLGGAGPGAPPPLPAAGPRRAVGARPVRFHAPVSPVEEGVPFVPAPGPPDPALAVAAARAVDTVDPLTRRRLRAGDPVFICSGQDGRCGAAFPSDIRDEIREEHEDRCPACGAEGGFTTTFLPLVPPPLPPAARPRAAAGSAPDTAPVSRPFTVRAAS